MIRPASKHSRALHHHRYLHGRACVLVLNHRTDVCRQFLQTCALLMYAIASAPVREYSPQPGFANTTTSAAAAISLREGDDSPAATAVSLLLPQARCKHPPGPHPNLACVRACGRACVRAMVHTYVAIHVYTYADCGASYGEVEARQVARKGRRRKKFG